MSSQTQTIDTIKHWFLTQGHVLQHATRLGGLTNWVFRVQLHGVADSSIVRLASRDDHGRSDDSTGASPLAQQAPVIIALHRYLAAAGIAPAVLGADEQLGLIWLADVGEPRTLHVADRADGVALLEAVWHLSAQSTQLMTLPTLPILHLEQHFAALAPRWHSMAQCLLADERFRQFQQSPHVLTHSDLNPQNWLHDGQRWWLIDWDYAVQAPKAWDIASLCVEHRWTPTILQQWFPDEGALQVWTNTAFALLSLDWHQRHASADALQVAGYAQLRFWWERCGVGVVPMYYCNSR